MSLPPAKAMTQPQQQPPPKPPKTAALREFVSTMNSRQETLPVRASVRRLQRQGRVAERRSQFDPAQRQLGSRWHSEENLCAFRDRRRSGPELRRVNAGAAAGAVVPDVADGRIEETEEEEEEEEVGDFRKQSRIRLNRMQQADQQQLPVVRGIGGHVRSVIEALECKSSSGTLPAAAAAAAAAPSARHRNLSSGSWNQDNQLMKEQQQQQQQQQPQQRHTVFLDDGIYAEAELLPNFEERIYDVAGYEIRRTASVEDLADSSEYACVSVRPERAVTDGSCVNPQQQQHSQSQLSTQSMKQVEAKVTESFSMFFKLAAVSQSPASHAPYHQPVTISSAASAVAAADSDTDDDDGSRSNVSEEVADRVRRAEQQKQLSEAVLKQGQLAKRTKQDQLFTGCCIISFNCRQQQHQQLCTDFCHPESFAKNDFCKSLPEFCFPDAASIAERNASTEQLALYLRDCDAFSFVMTEQTGLRYYGYCLRYQPTESVDRIEAACIVSSVDSEPLFRGVLAEARDKRLRAGYNEAAEFLVSVYNRPLPSAGQSFDVTTTDAQSNQVVRRHFHRPASGRLQHVRYSELLTFPGVVNTLQLFAAALHERKLVLVSRNPRLLSQCTQALIALLYPLQWQHVFVPILPTVMLHVVCSPTPFIVGVLRRDLDSVLNEDLEDDVIIADLDQGKFLRKKGDEKKLLSKKLHRSLLRCLDANRQLEARNPGITDQLIVATFLRFFAITIGHFEAHCSSKRFNKETFSAAPKSKGLRSLLKVLTETGNFHIFISDVLDGSAFESNKLTVSSVISDFNEAVRQFREEAEASDGKGFLDSFRSKMRKLFTVTKPEQPLQLQQRRPTLSSLYPDKPTNSLRSNASLQQQQQQQQQQLQQQQLPDKLRPELPPR